jgi:dihydroneopterin aldolase/2-amino-4-hydroxy-6-hydroxymethyldihydropteridine diphosphokinase
MNEINIRGLKVQTVHGVLQQEKLVPQPFIFDVNLYLDLFAAGASDDLSKTVNYAEVCQIIDRTARANCYDLIEKLAYECAFAVMEKFPLVQKIEVCVNKPQAPIGLPFDNVAVKVSLERERVILSLGSSLGDSTKLLLDAVDKLNDIRGVKVVKLSTIIETEPYGGVAKINF